MRWLLFLSRVAFICGIFFLLSFVARMLPDWADQNPVISTIIIVGHLMGSITVPVVNLCYLVIAVATRRLGQFVPIWLVIGNIIFLCIFIYYVYSQIPEA